MNQPYTPIKRKSTSDLINNQIQLESTPPNTTITDEQIEFPEGGIQSYVPLMYESTLSISPVIATLTNLSIFVKLLNTLLKTHATSNSWIMTWFLFMFFNGMTLFGDYSDKFTTILPTIIGSILVLISTSLIPTTSSFLGMLINFGLLGLGSSCQYLSSLITISHFFHKRRGYALGVCLSTGGVATSWFVNILLTSVLDDRDELSKVIYLFAGLWGCQCFLTIVFSLNRITDEHDYRLRSPILKELDKKRDELGRSWCPYIGTDLRLVHDVKFRNNSIAIGIGFGILFIVYSYLDIFINVSNVSTTEDTYFITQLITCFAIFSSVFIGVLSDSIGVFNVQIGSFLHLSIINLILLPFTNHHSYILYAYLGVLTISAFSIIITSFLSISALSTNTLEFGSRLSNSFGIASIPALIISRIAGSVLGYQIEEFSAAKFGVLITLLSLLGLYFVNNVNEHSIILFQQKLSRGR